MSAPITDANEFAPLAALRKAADHPAVAEIEGAGADAGRVFIHLKKGWVFDGYEALSASVGVMLDSEGASMTRAEIARENREQLAAKMALVKKSK